MQVSFWLPFVHRVYHKKYTKTKPTLLRVRLPESLFQIPITRLSVVEKSQGQTEAPKKGLGSKHQLLNLFTVANSQLSTQVLKPIYLSLDSAVQQQQRYNKVYLCYKKANATNCTTLQSNLDELVRITKLFKIVK